MFDMTTAAHDLLADLTAADFCLDDVEDLLSADAEERVAAAHTQIGARMETDGFTLTEAEFEAELAALVEVLDTLAEMGIDSMLALHGALAALASAPGQRAA